MHFVYVLIYLDQDSDSDAQKTIKYDFDLLERNCLVQKLFQNSDVSFVRVDIFNLDKYVSWADNNTGNASGMVWLRVLMTNPSKNEIWAIIPP